MRAGMGELVIELGKKKPKPDDMAEEMADDMATEKLDALKMIGKSLGVSLSDEKAQALGDALQEYQACCEMDSDEEDDLA